MPLTLLSNQSLADYLAAAVAIALILLGLARPVYPAATGKLGGRNYIAIIAAIVFLLFLLSGCFMLWLVYQHIGKTLTQQETFLEQVAFATTLFFAMLAGIVAKYFWELNKAGKSFADARLSDLLAPLFVSFLIFFAVWGTVAGKPIGFLSVGVAIQNGFFWQDIIQKQKP